MKVYLAGEAYGAEVFKNMDFKFKRLDSFMYVRDNKRYISFIPKYEEYLLDSGAFTFIMSKKKTKIDIDSFTDEYIDFIKDNKIDNFFEMDVDKIFGYEKVKQLSRRIEAKTGKQSIPVFHMSRGLDDWNSMCKDYKYVSLGIAGKDVPWGDTQTFMRFVMNAKSYGTKVHGLGITGMKTLKKVPFYSVDSSSWTCGNRYKSIFFFDGKEVKSVKVDLSNKRIKDHLKLAEHNFKQWVEFSNYMKNRTYV